MPDAAHADLASLIVPILASAAAVWFWCFLSWAILPIHHKDWQPLPDEEKSLDTLRNLGLAPGTYVFPECSHGKGNKEEMMAKWKRGPAGMLSIWPGNPSMGGKMIASFLVNVVVSLFVGYIASETLLRGAGFVRVLQVTGTCGLLAYCFAFLPNHIWFNAPKRATVTCVFDGVVQGLLVGLVFALLWPGLSTAG